MRRKEAQIGSQPIANADAARDWLDHAAEAATRDTGEARLRIRLWRPDRTAVRSVQTRVWAESPEMAGEVAETSAIRPLPNALVPAPSSAPGAVPVRSEVAAQVAPRPGRFANRAVHFSRPAPVLTPPPTYAATPAYPAPCPTCPSSAATIAVLQTRVAELVGRLASADASGRDGQMATARLEQTALARGRRIKELEAENAELRSANKALRREVRELNEGVEALLEAVTAFTG